MPNAAKSPATHLATTLFCILLAACGGGGSSGAQQASADGVTTPTPVVGGVSTETPSNDGNGGTVRPDPTPTDVSSAPAGTPPTSAETVEGEPALSVQLRFPHGITIDAQNNAYIVDSLNRRIRKITPAGRITTLAYLTAQFALPRGIAVDGSGNVFVSDRGTHTILKITPDGTVTTFAGMSGESGSTDALGTNARFREPSSMEFDAAGNLYVVDTYNRTIRKIDPAGWVTTVAGTAGAVGYVDATGPAARFTEPEGITIDAAGNLYVTDMTPYPPCHFCSGGLSTVRKITPAGVVTTVAGSSSAVGSADGIGTAALFAYPKGVAVDAAGNVYVADTNNATIRKIASGGSVTTIAGMAGAHDSVDGVGSAARLAYPQGITLDGAGNLYVTESFRVRRISPSGEVTTIAGSGQ
jgi:sugar lactone lactonase YvrE